jgi:hypothetical protein
LRQKHPKHFYIEDTFSYYLVVITWHLATEQSERMLKEHSFEIVRPLKEKTPAAKRQLGFLELKPGSFGHGWPYAAEAMEGRERRPTVKISRFCAGMRLCRESAGTREATTA